MTGTRTIKCRMTSSQRSSRCARWLLNVTLSVFVTTGCVHTPATSQVAPPQDAPYAVFAVSHGRHSGLVVERAALVGVLPSLRGTRGDVGGSARFLELGWGDEQFYRDPEPGVWDGLRALAWPTESTLHVVGFDAEPRERFAHAELIEVRLSAQQHARLLRHVVREFALDAAGAPIPIAAHHKGHGYFYRAGSRFHLFRTCNTWLAGAFEAAGLPVSDRLTLTSDGVLDQLRPLAVGIEPGVGRGAQSR